MVCIINQLRLNVCMLYSTDHLVPEADALYLSSWKAHENIVWNHIHILLSYCHATIFSNSRIISHCSLACSCALGYCTFSLMSWFHWTCLGAFSVIFLFWLVTTFSHAKQNRPSYPHYCCSIDVGSWTKLEAIVVSDISNQVLFGYGAHISGLS